MEESVDLGKIAREADKEERKAAAQKKKLDEKFKDDEEEETLPGVGLPKPKVSLCARPEKITNFKGSKGRHRQRAKS